MLPENYSVLKGMDGFSQFEVLKKYSFFSTLQSRAPPHSAKLTLKAGPIPYHRLRICQSINKAANGCWP